MKHIFLAFIISIFTQFSWGSEACKSMVYGGEFPKAVEEYVILCKSEFVIGYSTIKKTPIWVAMLIDPEKITSPDAVNSRPPFKVDPALPTIEQASLTDYYLSGYDRGHLAAYEDLDHSKIAANESMYLTNIIPQHSGNNRGIWAVLENLTREQSLDGSIYVITGPIFTPTSLKIGPNNIPVPDKLFKIIIDAKRKTIKTYIIPNASISSSELPKLLTTYETVEMLTGFDIIPALKFKQILQ